MPSLWLPGAAADAVIAEAEGRHEAGRMRDFIRRLQAIDSRLDCFLAERDLPDSDIRQGFYYLLRHNEDGTTTFWEVSNPDGTFREPDDAILEAFRKGDANRTDLKHERYLERRRREVAKERAERARLDEMHGRFQEEIDFAFRTQVPIRTGLPEAA